MKTRTHYPPAFWVCSASEIFERLAYYLGRSLILIFVTAAVANGGLGLSKDTAAGMQANLTAFSYLGALFGGFIVDKFIGAKYTTPIGMFIAGAGYFVGSIATNGTHIYIMIAAISIGLALFKNGPLLGRIITDPKQMDSAFSLRYMLVNVGAFIGTLSVGVLYKDVFAKDGVQGFVPCFRLAAISMILGGLWYLFVCWPKLGKLGTRPFKMEKTAEELEEAKKRAQLDKAERQQQPLTTTEKKRIAAIVLASAFSIIFWIFWYLAYLPAYYYWAEHADWVVFGYEIPQTWFDAANSFYCVALGPIMAVFWNKLAARPQGDMSLFRKTGIGILLLSGCYAIYAILDIVRGDGKISILWVLLVLTFFLTLGEMFFSPLGSSFISKYSPSRYLGIMMSMWGLSIFAAAKSYGYAYNALFGDNTTLPFRTACLIVIVIAAVSSIVMFILDKPLSRLVEHHD